MESSTHPDGSSSLERQPDRATRRVLQVCDAVGDFIEYWGFRAIHGRVWTLMALRGRPVPQVEVAETLGVSRSLVSGAVAELVELGLVKALGTHRNAPYEAVTDVWPTISDVLRSREWMLLESARMALEGAIEEVGLSLAAGEDPGYDLGRLRFLLGMTEIAQTLLRLLIGLRTPASVETVLRGWAQRAASFLQALRPLS